MDSLEHYNGPGITSDYFGGWVPPSEDTIEDFKATLPAPVVEDTGIYGAEPLPNDAFPWKAVEKVTGSPLPALNQGQRGSCCGFGWTNAMHITSACEIVKGDKEKWMMLSPSYNYGGGRFYIGGKGKSSPFRGDGSNAVWSAKFANQFGAVSRDQAGPYSEAQALEWGAKGPPKAMLDLGKDHCVKGISQVNNVDAACAALAAGYGVQIASNAGFTQKRDNDGFCVRSGVWQHSMAFIGYRGLNTKKPGMLVCNSWGANAASGPMPDMPHGGCFYISFRDAAYILESGDCWIYSSFDGFKTAGPAMDWSKLNF